MTEIPDLSPLRRLNSSRDGALVLVDHPEARRRWMPTADAVKLAKRIKADEARAAKAKADEAKAAKAKADEP